MDFENCKLDEIKAIKGTLSDHGQFNQNMDVWYQNIVSTSLELIRKDKLLNQNVSQELENQMLLTKKLNVDNDTMLDQAKQETLMRDLETEETTLKTDIEKLVQRIEKLKSGESASKIEKKLTVQRNLAKISKKLTSTSFEYQSPNVLGLISNSNGVQVFDLNPNKISEQDTTKYLWECLNKANTVSWLDIFNNDINDVVINVSDVNDVNDVNM